jgi:hypothetical protein
MNFQNLQAEFFDILLSRETKTDIFYPLYNVEIYRNNVTIILINTLLSIYPLIALLVGDDFFRMAAKAYIKSYPSRSSNLHDYGEYFSHFLTSYSPVKNLPYVAEVAHFEWTCHRLYFMTDHPLFNKKILEQISPDQFPQLRFILHPASQVINFKYPILRIIELCKGENNEMINIDIDGDRLLIIRRDLDIKLVSLGHAESAFLLALQSGASLSEAYNAAINIDVDFPLDQKLSQWVQDKTIVDIILEKN